MKKFFIACIISVLPVTSQAKWTKDQGEKYFDIMFQVTMTHQTYDDFFTVPQVVEHISCMQEFYEQNYTFEEFERKFYTGGQLDLDEFHTVEEICINRTLNHAKQKHNI